MVQEWYGTYLACGCFTAEVTCRTLFTCTSINNTFYTRAYAAHSAHPLPALLLLLEGPRLSIHAAWTIYQNRVGYAPLTPVSLFAVIRVHTVVPEGYCLWRTRGLPPVLSHASGPPTCLTPANPLNQASLSPPRRDED